MADAEIEVDLSQFAVGSIIDASAGMRLSQRSATHEPVLSPQEDDVDEAALEALMQQAQAFAPLDQRAEEAVHDREDDPKQDALGLTTLEDTAASAVPPPRGHLAVIDRLYKWERRRSAKLDKARREEQQRQSKEEESHCTFSPKVARPVSCHRYGCHCMLRTRIKPPGFVSVFILERLFGGRNGKMLLRPIKCACATLSR
jgi:hypothetical protein